MPWTSPTCSLRPESSPVAIHQESGSGTCFNDDCLSNGSSLLAHWLFFAASLSRVCRAYPAFGGSVTCRHSATCVLTTLRISRYLHTSIWMLLSLHFRLCSRQPI